MANYSVDQAQRDIANLRFLLTALSNVALVNPSPTFTGTVTFPDGSTWGVSGLTLLTSLGSPTFTGTVTLPDGTTWTSGGPSLHAPLPLAQGGTGANYGSNAALLSGIGGAPSASPTFTGTVTFPDGSTWTSSGLVTDTWHNVTLDTGWSTTTGYSNLEYRLVENQSVQVTGGVSHTSITATLAINSSNPIGASYRPPKNKLVCAGNSPLGNLQVELHSDGIFYALANSSGPGTKAIVDAIVAIGV